MKTTLFTVLFVVVAGMGTIHAAIVNGPCGKNLTWTLNTKSGVLTIEGKGEMNSRNYSYEKNWQIYRENIKSVNLPEGLTNIEANAFANCYSLSSVNIPKSVKKIETGVFDYCKSLTAIEIPDNVTFIGSGAFRGCVSLTSVAIPNNVTVIGNYAFAGCYNLTIVTIGNSVTDIGEHAFDGCRRLTSMILPKSIKFIGYNIFNNTNIMSVILYATTPPSLEASMGIESKCTLYLPAESVDTYVNLLRWEDFKQIKAIK